MPDAYSCVLLHRSWFSLLPVVLAASSWSAWWRCAASILCAYAFAAMLTMLLCTRSSSVYLVTNPWNIIKESCYCLHVLSLSCTDPIVCPIAEQCRVRSYDGREALIRSFPSTLPIPLRPSQFSASDTSTLPLSRFRQSRGKPRQWSRTRALHTVLAHTHNTRSLRTRTAHTGSEPPLSDQSASATASSKLHKQTRTCGCQRLGKIHQGGKRAQLTYRTAKRWP